MKYVCTLLLLMLSLLASGQGKPLADRVTDLEQMVERLTIRVEVLEASPKPAAPRARSSYRSGFVAWLRRYSFYCFGHA